MLTTAYMAWKRAAAATADKYARSTSDSIISLTIRCKWQGAGCEDATGDQSHVQDSRSVSEKERGQFRSTYLTRGSGTTRREALQTLHEPMRPHPSVPVVAFTLLGVHRLQLLLREWCGRGRV